MADDGGETFKASSLPGDGPQVKLGEWAPINTYAFRNPIRTAKYLHYESLSTDLSKVGLVTWSSVYLNARMN